MIQKKWQKEVIALVVNIIITLIAVVIVFQLWNRDINVPISYQNDGLGAVATVKGMIEGEGIWHRSYWSAPMEEDNYMVDYILPLMIIRVIILFVKDAAVVINIFWILTYILTAITTYLFLRKLGIRYSIAIFGSIIYNFLPYHYMRIEHFWLCGCYIIPLCLWLIMDAAGVVSYEQKQNVFLIGKLKVTKRQIVNLVLGLLIGLNGIYYSVFAVMLIMVMAFFNCISKKDIKKIAVGVYDTIAIFAPIVLFYVMPTVLWGNSMMSEAAATRNIYDIERYALKVAALFFPVQGHRIKALADFTEYYSEVFNLTNENCTVILGIIMSIGLVLSLLGVFCKSLYKTDHELVKCMGQINIVIILIACQGGLAAYIGIFVTTAIRCFNRMSIFIALASLTVVCISLENAIVHWKIKRYIELAGISALALFGIWDQTSAEYATYSLYTADKISYEWSYDEKEKDYYSLKNYFADIKQLVGEDAIIYMLPREPYYGPDNKPFAAIKSYVCSNGLRWSYSEWNAGYKKYFKKIEETGVESLLNTISVLDMSGVLVDSQSYSTEEEFSDVCQKIEILTGEKPVIDESGELYFYDIVNYKNELLKNYSTEQLQRMRTAIENEIKGIKITSVDTSELYLYNKGKVENECLIEKGDLQFGPYIDLEAGKYQITVVGKHLDEGTVKVTAGKGTKVINSQIIKSEENQLVYQFELKKDEDDVEFLLESTSSDLLVDGYYYERDMGYGYHDVLEYYQDLLECEEMNIGSMSLKLNSTNLFVDDKPIKTKKGQLVLEAGEEQYGPYIYLEKGAYIVSIEGENLQELDAEIGYNFRENTVEINYLSKEENKIVYEFNVKKDIDTVEITLRNNGKTEALIDSYVCTKTDGLQKRVANLKIRLK